MAIEFRQLQYVIAAHKHRSFRQAAVALQLKQSTLSRRVLQLENELGVQLFVRHSGGVSPTTAGQDFLRIAQHIAEEMDALMSLAKAEAHGEAGRLVLGFYVSLSAGDLAETLREFSAEHPNLKIYPVEEGRTGLLGDVQNGLIDCAIVSGGGEVASLVHLPLWSESVMAAVPEGHPFARLGHVTWNDLKRDCFLLSRHDPGPELHDLLMARLAEPGERPDIRVHDVGRDTIIGMVAAGHGVALTTASSTGLIHAGTVYRAIWDDEGVSEIRQTAYWRAGNENPVLPVFIRMLKSRHPDVAV